MASCVDGSNGFTLKVIRVDQLRGVLVIGMPQAQLSIIIFPPRKERAIVTSYQAMIVTSMYGLDAFILKMFIRDWFGFILVVIMPKTQLSILITTPSNERAIGT